MRRCSAVAVGLSLTPRHPSPASQHSFADSPLRHSAMLTPVATEATPCGDAQTTQKIPLDVTSSDAFNTVLQTILQQRQKREQRSQRRLLFMRAAQHEIDLERTAPDPQDDPPRDDTGRDDDDDDDVYDEMDDDAARLSRVLTANAQRAWGIIRRKVHDMIFERKKKENTCSWKFVHRTVTHMTGVEKARQDLYRKYIDNPNSWMEGIVNFPAHLRPENRKQHVTKPTARKRKTVKQRTYRQTKFNQLS